MVRVIGVRFKKAGKIYYFDPDNIDVRKDQNVIVETARGVEFGEVVVGSKDITEEEIVSPLKKVLRIATLEDEIINKENKEKEKKAFEICLEKIEEHGLEMKLIDVEYTFDNNKVIFYFTADGRVDFRELVKDLASIFRTRIELRQIGVRDEAKMIGGMGPCGVSLCCSTWLGEFEPVSIKMAKEQNLSLNPTKISGICGRLMCCLRYEHESYTHLRKGLPNQGEKIITSEGPAIVIDNNVLLESVKVRLIISEDEDNQVLELSDDIYIFHKNEIERIDKDKIEEHEENTDDIDNIDDLYE
ncbi:PSP1 domain-containing protein [Paramaledivibacter caminithermalis]|jgi:cell fate regulator YaaT (PSP1 superfamily)|uniref:Cell fate regulator YaaT, PSP1 superfamily (Controls sporulation, competence, biofilm development) n=1 Tax=Paramaledivibacter caminithermalis (strain DSM 15212 / CIP 107654 / DViRD3) TaxID=1121301 RepID=A0A1M6QAR3_PARC5|nr:stage 0 sporulation family protein [Paramaledivibacter caminithermalis]SHK17248.1 Cell fate regulator YaaT, PSP1 superfamily (controls sporulation, competence, biofilm development) [Paramaledivibacter caminithermalis DSM 15212]